MHAYLIYAKTNCSELEKKISEIIKKKEAIGLEFSVVSINDVKKIQQSVKLQTKEKRAFIIRNIEEASLPALNAMLKLLEEPPKDILFVLTTNTLNTIIPTIKSRCQVIQLSKKNKIDKQKEKEIQEFLQMEKGRMLLYTEKLNKREDAIDFLENLITFVESKIEKWQDQKEAAKILTLSRSALLAIKSNGNTKLQLTKLIINL